MLLIGIIIGAAIFYAVGPSKSGGSTVTSTATVNGLAPPPVTNTNTITNTNTVTVTNTVTNTQYITTIVTTTSISVDSVELHGTQTVLPAGSTEVIPSGQKSIILPSFNFAYSGEIIVTYTATNAVSLSYTDGSTTIASPNSETGNGIILPVASGSPQISVLNGSCPLIGSCPSITLTMTITYEY